MLKVRGFVLLSTLRHISAGLAPEQKESFRNALEPGLRSLLEGPIDARGWVPAAALAGAMEAYAALLPVERSRTYRLLGRLGCEDTLAAAFQSQSRLTQPEFVLRRALQVWRDHYDRGDFEVLESLPESGRIRVTEAGFPHPSLCHRIGGWIERAIELSGGREVVVEHPVCTFVGGGAEEWQARWRT